MISIAGKEDAMLEELWKIIQLNQDAEAQYLYSKILQSNDSMLTKNEFEKYLELKKRFLE